MIKHLINSVDTIKVTHLSHIKYHELMVEDSEADNATYLYLNTRQITELHNNLGIYLKEHNNG